MIKRYSITVNGNNYDVEVEELGLQNTTVSRPQNVNNVQQQSVSQSQSKPQVIVQGSGSISAPMPGTINNILVSVGDSVKKGQVLLILEAMKMENEIMASCDGTVSAINISNGASVNVGDILITIG